MPYGAVIGGLNITKNIKSFNTLVPDGCIGVVKKGAGKVKKGKKSKMNQVKMKDIDLTEYYSKPFIKALEKEFGYAHPLPLVTFVCTCQPKEENVKTFYLSYPKPENFEKRELIISSESKITDIDLKKFKRAFLNGKYKR